ncbi:hypothetical protein [Mesorhizobium sp. WSM4904]|uniref:hypothetical protein n=1 Tax=Mesorhizobium sp. WSM4904 TaxID=3038545 RepID=UPI0024189B75|nr:hypothetical protein [Mesorhizobium sp. WSM4904]WFP63246.1 hypothetical protein QAZ47_01280 [Mesorhizobium sp. WSM4904]
MPPAHFYAALQLLHGNIYESSLIYRALINSRLRWQSSMMTSPAFAFWADIVRALNAAFLPFK